MKMLVAVPPMPFVLVEDSPSLRTLQQLVRGRIEGVYTSRPDIVVYVNEESLIQGLMPNREANRLLRTIIGYDNLLCGPVVIIGSAEEAYTDVPETVFAAATRGCWRSPSNK